jgi:EmrB/QacA subfamily drug resistance transporter
LALASLLILDGALTDFYGRKRGFVIGLGGFTVASLLCGLAFSTESLIVFRLLQGASGAFLVPGSLAIITAAFSKEEQGRAFGIWAGASAVTTILGPFVGGVLVDLLSWRAAFLLNIPLLAIALWATLANVNESRDDRAAGRFDWYGAALVAVAIGGLGFGAIRGQESQWQDSGAFAGIALGVAALVAVPIWMVRSSHPLVPPSLFRSRNFSVVNVATVLIYGALYVVFYFVPVFLQGVLGYNAASAGIALASVMVFTAAFSPRFGRMAARHGPRWFMAAGPAVMALGLLWLTRIPADSEAWLAKLGVLSSLIPPGSVIVDVLPAMLVFGLGTMMMVAPLTTALMTSIPQKSSGVASAVNNAVSRIGPPLATAAIFIVANSIFFGTLGDLAPDLDTSAAEVRNDFSPLNRPADGMPQDLRDAADEASTDAFSFAMLAAAGMLAAGAAVSAIGIKNPSKVSDEQRAMARVVSPAAPCPPLDIDCLPDMASAGASGAESL